MLVNFVQYFGAFEIDAILLGSLRQETVSKSSSTINVGSTSNWLRVKVVSGRDGTRFGLP